MFNDLFKRVQEAGKEPRETVRQALERLGKELLIILKSKKIGFLGLGLEKDNFAWQAIADGEPGIKAGLWYFGNYGMHYSDSVSSGYNTPEEVVQGIIENYKQDVVDGDDESELDKPLSADTEFEEHATEVAPDEAVEQSNWEHDAETIFPTIIKGWKPEVDEGVKNV